MYYTEKALTAEFYFLTQKHKTFMKLQKRTPGFFTQQRY